MAMTCTSTSMHRFTRCIARRHDAALAPVGMKMTQFATLSALASAGPMRPSDLAQSLGIATSTMSRNLRPLMVEGWVSLEGGSDWRSQLASLTPEGERKQREGRRHQRSAQQGLVDALGAEQVARLNTLIRECLAALECRSKPCHETP